MGSLEAAASLFGSDDSGADPFASLGSESHPTESSAHSAADGLFSTTENSSVPDFSSFSSESVPSVEQSREQGTLVDSTQSSNYELGSNSTLPNAGSSTQSVSYEQGYSVEWQNYPQHAVNGTSHVNTHASPYDPYAPSQRSSVQSQPENYAPTSYVPSSTSQTNNYSANYSPYTPPAPAAPAQPYNAYTPSQSTYIPKTQPTQYGTPAYSSTAQTPHGAQNTSAVPPPAPKAALNRPKVSNAYDPPFPTTTTSRRRPTPSSSVYNTYNPVSPPLPPSNASYSTPSHPPPRPPSNASYSAQPLPPPRPPSNSSYTSGAYSPQTHPPPRPSSNASYSSQSHLPPSRPPSTSYSPQAFQSTPSGTASSVPNYFSGLNQESGASPHTSPQFASYSPPANQQSGVVPESTGSYGQNHDSQNVTSTDEFDPEGFDSHAATTETVANSKLDTSGVTDLHSPYEPTALEHSPEESISMSPNVPSNPAHEHGGYADFNNTQSQTELGDSSGRTSSPGVFSNPSWTASPAMIFSKPPHNSMASPLHDMPRTGSPVSTYSLDTQSPAASAPSDPYRPLNGAVVDPYAPKSHLERKASSPPSTTSYGSNPYLPQKRTSHPPRSMSIGSTASTKSEDPYAPSLHSRVQSNESDYERGSYSTFNHPSNDAYLNAGSGLSRPQDIYVKAAPTHTPYAPSPSLLGTNDPLGRSSARIPVFNFGFGGKIVTCFHGADKLNTGFDVALASRNSTGVQIRVLNKIIPESALSVSVASFPGPLFSDPGSPTTSLVRPGVSAQAKTKKARVVKYLEERVNEISQGLNYLHSGSLEQRKAEGKLVLVKFLKIMVENDGKISGSPQVEAAVRAALVPRLDLSLSESESNSLTVSGFTPADIQGSTLDESFVNPSDAPVATYGIRPSVLEKIRDFLLRGQHRQAYHYALDQKLWAHAMVIASGIDKESWQEAVNEFMKTELGSVQAQTPLAVAPSSKESLRVAYGLFSGQGAVAVQQLVPENSLTGPTSRLTAPTSHVTPITPNFATPLSVKIPMESLSQWAETVAMSISGTLSPETSAAITALGDHLAANHWIEAAHACYLLAPQTSPIAGAGHQSARIVLLGSRNPQLSSNFASDPDPIIFSEILEFALSLTPTAKGQEPFGGLPHLQSYRFIRAVHLAEVGDISLANRYCEAITASLNRPSPYFTGVLLEQIRGLSDRIVGVTHIDKSGSWMGSKISKPSLDSIGGWLEGRFTKLVTGDLDSPGVSNGENSKTEDRGFAGPFSHYSTISSTTTSTSPSPQSSVVNLNVYAPPPPRTGSSLSNRSALGVAAPVDRASSAMDYSRPKPAPGPRVASASAATTTFAQSQSFGQAASYYSPYSHMNNGGSPQDMMTPRPTLESTEEEGQEVAWWGSSSAATPTATSFVRLNDAPATESSDGFISLMDDASYTVASKPSRQQTAVPEDEEEDLGFGNSKPRRKPATEVDPKADANADSSAGSFAKAPEKEPAKPAANASSGWFSRFWKRESTPGPVKANLGEEVSFYYDKELKRWVNKTAGGTETPKATPPPPPRAQTASPAGISPRPPSAGMRPPSTGPPPLRSASTADLPSGKPPMRVRSNLVPDSEAGSAPSTPTGSRLASPAPPPGRLRSQASKRNIRNRYVDVLQQEGAA